MLTGGDDVPLDIAASVTPGHQMFCDATEEPDSTAWYAMECAEDFWISLPHGLLTVIALPRLPLGGLASEISYSFV